MWYNSASRKYSKYIVPSQKIYSINNLFKGQMPRFKRPFQLKRA